MRCFGEAEAAEPQILLKTEMRQKMAAEEIGTSFGSGRGSFKFVCSGVLRITVLVFSLACVLLFFTLVLFLCFVVFVCL